MVNIPREAHAAKEGRCKRIGKPLRGIGRSQRRPDLVLACRNQAHDVCRNNRNFRRFVGIGERAHRAEVENRWFEPVPARSADLDDQPRELTTDFPEEFEDTFDVRAEAFARRFCAITTDADGVIVVHLQIADAIIANEVDDFLRQVAMHPRVAKIPEPSAAALDRNSVKVELVTGFCEAFRHFGHQFELEPDARNQASFPDGIRRRSKPAGKRFAVHIPVPDF